VANDKKRPFQELGLFILLYKKLSKKASGTALNQPADRRNCIADIIEEYDSLFVTQKTAGHMLWMLTNSIAWLVPLQP
jgi:hypothetical protein